MVPPFLRLLLLFPLTLAQAGISDLTEEEKKELRSALSQSDLTVVERYFDAQSLHPSDEIYDTSIYLTVTNANTPEDGRRLELLEYLLDQGGPMPSGRKLNSNFFIRSIVEESTVGWIKLLSKFSRQKLNNESHDNESALSRGALTRNPEVLNYLIELGFRAPEKPCEVGFRTRSLDDQQTAYQLYPSPPPPAIAAVVGMSYLKSTRTKNYPTVNSQEDPEIQGIIEQVRKDNARASVKTGRSDAATETLVVEMLQALESTAINWNATDAYGMTALHHAAWAQWPKVVEYLIDQGCRKEATDEHGRLPFHFAASHPTTFHREIASRLILDGVDAEDGDGRTALAHADESGNGEARRVLLEIGAQDTNPVAPGSAVGGTLSPNSTAIVGGEGYLAVVQDRLVEMSGLLFVDTAGRSVGEASSLILTLTPRPAIGSNMEVGFNRPVGKSMKRSIPKITKFLKQRIGAWPINERAEFRFENKYNPTDGDSASVVCSLLLYSALTSYELNTDLCITGSMDPEGNVKAIGGLAQKMEGGVRRGIPLLGFPKENYQSMQDNVIEKGIVAVAGFQAFTLEHFSDALELASAERPPKLSEAIDRFAEIQAVGKKNPSHYKNPATQQELRQILELAPNHATARLLIEIAAGKLPKNLSLGGSYDALEQAWKPMRLAIGNGDFGSMERLEENLYATSASLLTRLRPRLAKDALPLCDAVINLSNKLKEFRERSNSSRTTNEAAWGELVQAENKITTEMKAFAEKWKLIHGDDE